MLGVAESPRTTHADALLLDVASDRGVENTYRPTEVAVFFGEPGKAVPDPYFGGDGPERSGCVFCGGCMVGCRHNAKNTLDKNYLYLAEKLGVDIFPETQVDRIAPMADRGYELSSVCSIRLFRRGRTTWRAPM